MMTTSEKATQKSITLPTRSVHHSNFLWALCQELVLSTTHRSLAQNGAGLPFLEISASSPRSLRRSRVAFESYPRSRWTFSSPRATLPGSRPPYRGFQAAVASRGGWLGCQRPERDAFSIHHS
jgi:hypothetical protein